MRQYNLYDHSFNKSEILNIFELGKKIHFTPDLMNQVDNLLIGEWINFDCHSITRLANLATKKINVFYENGSYTECMSIQEAKFDILSKFHKQGIFPDSVQEKDGTVLKIIWDIDLVNNNFDRNQKVNKNIYYVMLGFINNLASSKSLPENVTKTANNIQKLLEVDYI